MYVKIYSQILDSSLADDRKLRHFFMDLLLCSDPDGNVLMTNEAISRRIRASMEEVAWGMAALQRPDSKSGTSDYEGRRIEKLPGHGYGWRILNYEKYRDYRSAKEKREKTNERVKRWREGQKMKSKPLPGEAANVKIAEREGDAAAQVHQERTDQELAEARMDRQTVANSELNAASVQRPQGESEKAKVFPPPPVEPEPEQEDNNGEPRFDHSTR